MLRAGCRSVLICLALLAPLGFVRADDTEVREFSIFVDGKEAGSSRMTIVQKDDGTSYMSATFEVKFRHLLIIDYAISLKTQEWWKKGRLIGMETTCTENGKKTEVTVGLDKKDQLGMRINGKETALRSDVWTNSFWKLADARFHNKQVPILEVDTGKEFNTDLKYVGAEKVKVGGQMIDCYHFLVVAAPGPIDLWFDKYHRLVRQEFTESGHKTIVKLENIKR
jgi:Family of unknown function (DUF6134)